MLARGDLLDWGWIDIVTLLTPEPELSKVTHFTQSSLKAFLGWVERVVDSVDVVIGDKEAEVEGEVDLKS